MSTRDLNDFFSSMDAGPSKKPRDPNVLFDVEDDFGDFEEEDDFGDFEDASPAPVSAPAQTQDTPLISGNMLSPSTAHPPTTQGSMQGSLLDLIDLDMSSGPPPASASSFPPVRTTKEISKPELVSSFAGMDFFASSPPKVQSVPLQQHPGGKLNILDDNTGWNDFNNASEPTSENPVKTTQNSFVRSSSTPKPPSSILPSTELNILDDDARWNDFNSSRKHTVNPSKKPSPTSAPILSLSKPIPSTQVLVKEPNIINDNSFWDDFENTTKPTPTNASKPSSAPKPAASTLKPRAFTSTLNIPSTSDDDPWDDIDARPTTSPTKENPLPFPLPDLPNHSPAPTVPQPNIPPPSLLLSLLPPLFTQAQQTLHTLSTLPAKTKPAILSHPRILEFLRAYLALGVVAARILAGRKMRWKRDGMLAGSMSISAASGISGKGGGKGGMKIRSIDKFETNKEDREALDVVHAWRGRVGRLRSVVSAAAALGVLEARVPEIGERIGVRRLGEEEGGVPGAACGVCGLRREERVAGEEGVLDAFGEWWVEGLGWHKGCWNFWEGQREKLRGR
ncbi:hypothetical protein M501DRAFT_1017669 [Patellaria atrata CBS 101060]|uniref:Uncharacterized protein n=1 Tax=Patellaria atrata CBS 101060 TaxID=1346257 RepID=A0A9P4VQ34_9PEZI|nr:hypothetical protein M501DRAFT_1017669 [Patellaria atrata CBS 101060]